MTSRGNSASGTLNSLPPATVRHIRELSDADLHAVVTTDANGFRPDVVAFAREEWERRGRPECDPQERHDESPALNVGSPPAGGVRRLPDAINLMAGIVLILAMGGFFNWATEIAAGHRVSFAQEVSPVLALFLSIGLFKRRRSALVLSRVLSGAIAALNGASALIILTATPPLDPDALWIAFKGFVCGCFVFLYLLESPRVLAAFPANHTPDDPELRTPEPAGT